MSWQWSGREGARCRHGYPHGDCPMACIRCGHRCELHTGEDDACTAIECGCPAWADDDEAGESDAS